jgi:hypothetical protein
VVRVGCVPAARQARDGVQLRKRGVLGLYARENKGYKWLLARANKSMDTPYLVLNHAADDAHRAHDLRQLSMVSVAHKRGQGGQGPTASTVALSASVAWVPGA